MPGQSENFPGCPAPTCPGENGVWMYQSSSVVRRDEVDPATIIRIPHGHVPRPHVARTSPRPRGAGRPRARAIVRSSSRGGDSGDPDEPGPGPRAGRLETQAAILAWVAERTRTLAALVAGWTA
jgi:hypothetical protein